MRCHVLLALAVLLFGSAARAEGPRAVLERAVNAMGLKIDPARRPAVLLHFRGQGRDTFRAQGTIHYGSSGARRLDMSVQEGKAAHKSEVHVVLTATGGFTFTAHGVADLPAEVVAGFRTMETLFSPLALLSLLDARDVGLKELNEIKIDGRPVRRIRLAIGKEIAHLDFDRQTGLLVRAVAKFDNVELTSSFRDYGDPTQEMDLQTLAAAGFPEAGFVSYLRQRAQAPHLLEKAVALLPQLSNESHHRRERAAAELTRLGRPAIPVLRLALRDRDPEVVRKAQQILDVLEKLDEPALLRAAIRQTVHYRPKSGVAALLGLVPIATPEELCDIRAALFALAQTDGQLEPTLVRALDDPDPKIRAVAEFIHGKDRETLAKKPGRQVFLRGIRLPARVRTQYSPDAVDGFELVDVQFFNSFDPGVFQKP